MRPSRRQFFVFTGSTVAAVPLLVSCSSNDSSNSAAGLATAEGASPSETGAHYGNLSGELLWQRYDSATPVTPSMNPETGEKVVPVPQADPATADHKAQNVPIPQEDDLMFKEDFQGLRNTFAYYVACINYARMTGDLVPALKVVHSENTVDLERLKTWETLYAEPNNSWIVGGTWKISVSEKPTEHNGKFSWECTATQENGTLINKTTNVTKPLSQDEIRDFTALYAQWVKDRWLIISPQQFDPAAKPTRAYTPAPQPTSTYTPKVSTIPADY